VRFKFESTRSFFCIVSLLLISVYVLISVIDSYASRINDLSLFDKLMLVLLVFVVAYIVVLLLTSLLYVVLIPRGVEYAGIES